jgi:hypothetical protein
MPAAALERHVMADVTATTAAPPTRAELVLVANVALRSIGDHFDPSQAWRTSITA